MFGIRRALFSIVTLLIAFFTLIHTSVRNKLQTILLRILSSGPVPRHVAFIMDGNRRYARQRGEEVIKGHEGGFGALKGILEVCLKLNVHCVTVYAFALDNFKRPQKEVDALMALAETKLVEMCEHGDLLDKYGVKLNILGRKELFPPSVRAAFEKAEGLTRHNKRSILNVCMAYSSTDEMTTAVQNSIRNALERDLRQNKKGYLSLKRGSGEIEITMDDIDSELMTSKANSPPVDILVRSSGVSRLSDFLLWQCNTHTQIHFIPTYWPQFSLSDFLPILISYQKYIWSRPRPGLRGEVKREVIARSRSRKRAVEHERLLGERW